MTTWAEKSSWCEFYQRDLCVILFSIYHLKKVVLAYSLDSIVAVCAGK